MPVESAVRQGREIFGRHENKVNTHVGYSSYVIVTLAIVHLTMASIITCNYVGKPVTCYEHTHLEESCLSEMHFRAYKGDTSEKFAYFKITPLVYGLIGKYIYFIDISISSNECE